MHGPFTTYKKMSWSVRLHDIGFNPSIVLLPTKLSEYLNATYSLLDENFIPLHNSFMRSSDDSCESGRWRGCNSRLLVNGASIGITYVNF